MFPGNWGKKIKFLGCKKIPNDWRFVKLKCWHGSTCFLSKQKSKFAVLAYFGGKRKLLVYVRNAVAAGHLLILWRKIEDRHKGERRRRGRGRGGKKPRPLPRPFHHHHHQSLFIHEIVSFYMVFLGIVFKTRLKYSKKLLTIMLKIQKLTLWVTMGHGVFTVTRA